jgi:hypothetical protein
MNSTSNKITSTLDGYKEIIDDGRQVGNSTRQIDMAIQIIFGGGECIVEDHHEMGNNRKANLNLYNRILNRLKMEHQWVFENKRIILDRNKLSIKLR